MTKPAPAYNGTEPYVFVSYAHADSAEVFRQIAWMQSMGLNIWYDEGIEPGSRWTDFLAEKVQGSSLVLYMVTEQSVASVHCRNEIEFALETDRQILLVYLEPAELAAGQRLTLSSRQAILKYDIGRDDYSRKLVDAVASALDTSVSEVKPAPAKRRSWVALASGIAGPLFLAIGGWYFLSEPPIVRAADDLLPVVIADLANDTEDRLFSGSLEEVLRVGLQVAPFVDVRDSKALRRQAREQVGEDGLSLDTARLLAARENIELVIGPRIALDGGGYRLEVEAIDPVTGESRARSSGSVTERAEVLNEMTRQAQMLRVQLGDSSSSADKFADSFSTNSLDALNAYVQAQQAAFAWDHQAAADLYRKATEQDPDFGRAYSGWAYSERELGREGEAADLFAKAVATLGGAQERERLRTLGLYYATVTLNYQKANETFSELLEKYPADTASLNNLTMLAFLSGRFDDAAASGAELVERFPEEPLYGGNLALFQMYASDIRAAAQTASQVLELHPDYYMAYLPIAIEAALGGNYRAAEEAYRSMAELGDTAARRANLGLIDLALTRGDTVVAQRLIGEGIKLARDADATSGLLRRRLLGASLDPANVPNFDTQNLPPWGQFLLGEAALARGARDTARAAQEQLGGVISPDARRLRSWLGAQLALAGKDPVAAERALQGDFSNSWMSRLLRGQAHLMAGQPVVAMDEFNRAWDQRGEATALLLDDIPTLHRLVEVKYWQGRAFEAMGQAEDAAANYRAYLAFRDRAGAADARVAAVQRTLESLQR